MTRTAIYSLQDNALTEEPSMELPEVRKMNYDGDYRQALKKYDEELGECRTIPAHESARSLWKEGQEVVEGKDYEVREADWMPETEDEYNEAMYEVQHELTGPVPKVLTAFPLPVKSDDDQDALWRDVYAEAEGAIDWQYQEMNDKKLIAILKKRYIINKR